MLRRTTIGFALGLTLALGCVARRPKPTPRGSASSPEASHRPAARPRFELAPQHLDISLSDVVDLGCRRGVCDSPHYGRSGLWTDGTHALLSVGLRVVLIDVAAGKLLRHWHLAEVTLARREISQAGSGSVAVSPPDAALGPMPRQVSLDGTDALALTPDRRTVLAVCEVSPQTVVVVHFDASSELPARAFSCSLRYNGRPGDARFAPDASAAFIRRDGAWLRCRTDRDGDATSVAAADVPPSAPGGLTLKRFSSGDWTVVESTPDHARDAQRDSGEPPGHRLTSECPPAWSADGATAATRSDYWSVELWRTKDWSPARRYSVPLGTPVDQLAFEPNGALLAAGMRGQVDLWDVTRSSIVETLRYEHTGDQGRIYPYPAYSRLGWDARRGLVSVRNLAVPALVQWSRKEGHFSLEPTTLFPLAVFPTTSGVFVVIDEPPPLWLRELPSGRRVKPMPLRVSEVHSPAISRDGAIAAGLEEADAVALYRARPDGAFQSKPALRWSPSGGLLGPGVSPVDSSSQEPILLRDPALSDDGRMLAWVHDDEIVVVQTTDGSLRLRRKIDVVPWNIAFDPAGRWLAWVVPDSDRGMIELLSVTDGALQPIGFPHPLTSVPVFSPDSQWLAAGTFDGVMFVNLADRTWRYLSRTEHEPTALGLSVSDNGNIQGAPAALETAWMRGGDDLLAPLVSARASNAEGGSIHEPVL
jgi:WD40 repeat protein